MSKLTVKDIENRLLRRIFDKTNNQSLQSHDLEAAMVAMLNDYEMRIQRQAGQLSVYQSIETNAKYPAPSIPADFLNGPTADNMRSMANATLNQQKQGDLWLVSVASEAIRPTIKLVRELTGLGLKEAKDLVDKVRGWYCPLGYGTNRDAAAPQKLPLLHVAMLGIEADKLETLVKRFADIGATVEIR